MPEKSFWNDKKDKKWWENFWFYYKTYIIVSIIAIFILSISVSQCMSKVVPDLTVTYIGNKTFTEDNSMELKNKLSEYVDDITGSYLKQVEFIQISSDKSNFEQDSAMQQREMLEVAVGDTFLYIMDKNKFDIYNKDGLFIDISDVLGKNEPVYGVNLNDSLIFKELGFKNMDFYAGVRVINENNSKDKNLINQQTNAKKVLLELSKK